MRSLESEVREIEYQRNLRAERIARGLTAKGKPRRRPGPTYAHQSPAAHIQQTRALGLEAITWMATKKWREPAHLLGLHAFAANLPLQWWSGRDHFTIARLVEVLESERDKQFGVQP